jgi:GNAT superfamily N-acetyltransferase
MSITVRRAVSEDLAILLQFEQGLIKAELPMDDTIIRNEITHYYDIPAMLDDKHTIILLAEMDGHAVGCGYGKILENNRWSVNKSYGYIGFMYVDEAYRGRGISDMIIKDLCQWFRENNLNEVRLKVYEKNESAIKAYLKSGFNEHMKEMRFTIQPEG